MMEIKEVSKYIIHKENTGVQCRTNNQQDKFISDLFLFKLLNCNQQFSAVLQLENKNENSQRKFTGLLHTHDSKIRFRITGLLYMRQMYEASLLKIIVVTFSTLDESKNQKHNTQFIISIFHNNDEFKINVKFHLPVF